MKLSWLHVKEMFGRSSIEVGDQICVNGSYYEVESVDPEGASFALLEDDDSESDAEEEEEEELDSESEGEEAEE